MLSKLDEFNLYRVLFLDGVLFFGFCIYQFLCFQSFPIYESHSGLNWTPLSLELSSDYTQITNLVGRVGDEGLALNLDKILGVLELDYIFIASYIIYFLAIFELAVKISNPSVWLKGIYYFLLVLIIVLDISQNFFLIEILNSNLTFPKTDWIFYLPRVSIILWNLIFLNLGVIGVLLWFGTTEPILRILSLFFFLPQIFSVFSFLGRLSLLEVALEISVIGLLGFFIFSIWKMATYLVKTRDVAR